MFTGQSNERVTSMISSEKSTTLLPNNRIHISAQLLRQTKNILGEDLYHHYRTLLEIDARPNILMAAMEFGTLYIKNQPITAKVGGMAVVINDMVKYLPHFLQTRNANISFLFMMYDGIPEATYVRQFTTYMAGKPEVLTLYKEKHENGATLYFLDHELFRRRSVRNPWRNLYQPAPGELYSGREEWEEAYTLALFNKGIARVREFLDAKIYHAHDYHTGLAVAYMPTDIVTTMTIHNAGPGYQGTYYTRNFGQERMPHPHYQYGIPAGDHLANDYLLNLLQIDFDKYMRYFEQNGQFNTLKVINYIADHNLVGGIPVSQGYAFELKRNQEYNVTTLVDGIENGLSNQVHARKHPFLRKKKDFEIAQIHSLITHAQDRREWLNGLNFGHDLESAEGIAQVHATKAKLKEMLQRNADLEINPNKPLFVTVSRLVDQKNIRVFAENINHIVSLGGQVIIAGQPGDQSGHDLAAHIHYLEYLPQNRGQVRFYNTFVNREMNALIQAGGDFFVLTSKFEPCGLTDIEAAWLGTVPLAKKTGGLGKVKNGFYYEWENHADLLGEANQLKHKINQVMFYYYSSPKSFQNRRIGCMKEDFAWNIALSKYFENYRSAAFYKVIKKLTEQYHQGLFDLNIAKEKLTYILKQVPEDLFSNLKRLLQKKENQSDLEFLIASGYFDDKLEDSFSVYADRLPRRTIFRPRISQQNDRLRKII